MKRYPKKGRARWKARLGRPRRRRCRVWHLDARQVKITIGGIEIDSGHFYDAPPTGYVRRYEPDGSTRDERILAETVRRDVEAAISSATKVPYNPGCFFCGIETVTGPEPKPHAPNCVMRTPDVVKTLETVRRSMGFK